jgi:hypothetical protein
MLSKVVEHEEALRAFEESKWTLADAAQLTDLPMEIFRSSIAEAKSNLEAGRG